MCLHCNELPHQHTTMTAEGCKLGFTDFVSKSIVLKTKWNFRPYNDFSSGLLWNTIQQVLGWDVQNQIVPIISMRAAAAMRRSLLRVTGMKFHTLLTLGLLVATIAKAAAVIALGPASIEMDASEYWQLSTLVMQGDLWMTGEPIAYRTPAYPWFLAIVRSLFGEHALLAVVVIQATMWTAAVWIAGKITVRITQSAWALPLTLLVSLPAVSAITYSTTLLTESMFTLLLMLSSLLVLCYCQQPSRRVAILIGLLLACTVLTRPIAIYWWLAHLVLVIWAMRQLSFPIRWSDLALAVIAFSLLLSPWMWRNHQLFCEPFVTKFLGRNIWIVTFQDGSGAGLELPETSTAIELARRLEHAGVADQWRGTWVVSHALVESGLSDPEADGWMRDVAFAAIAAHPAPFAYKSVRRIVNFWRCAVTDLPIQGSANGEYMGQAIWSHSIAPVSWAIDHRPSRRVWFNTTLVTIVVIATMILIVNLRTRCYGVWLGLTFAYFSVVTGLVEIPNYRYRVVLEPLSAATVAAALVVISASLVRRSSRQR